MCFSPEASLAAGVALLPVGAYALGAAWRKDRRYLPVAAMPLVFGVQQLFEAVVWLGLGRSDAGLVKPAALAFLFFAVAFWPVWIPFAAAAVEPRPPWRRLFAALAVVGLAVGCGCYVAAAANFDEWVAVTVVGHSIRYDLSGIPGAETAAGWAWQALYLGAACVPMLLSRDRRLRVFGLAVAVSAVVTHVAFRYAFTSVWCFFAALLSAHICYVLYRLPDGAAEVGPAQRD